MRLRQAWPPAHFFSYRGECRRLPPAMGTGIRLPLIPATIYPSPQECCRFKPQRPSVLENNYSLDDLNSLLAQTFIYVQLRTLSPFSLVRLIIGVRLSM